MNPAAGVENAALRDALGAERRRADRLQDCIDQLSARLQEIRAALAT